MRYNVAGLLKSHSGVTREADVEASVALGEAGVKLLAPVRGRLCLTRDTDGVLVQGELSTAVEVACARCLVPVAVDLKLAIAEQFRPTAPLPGGPAVEFDPAADPATLIDELHVLDIGEVVRQAVLLETPLHALCRPDCKGICAECGLDLNTGTCACGPQPDPRWDVLRAMLDD